LLIKKILIIDGEADMDIIEEWVNEEKTTILSKMDSNTSESECKCPYNDNNAINTSLIISSGNN